MCARALRMLCKLICLITISQTSVGLPTEHLEHLSSSFSRSLSSENIREDSNSVLPGAQKKKKLLLILADGVRYDYFRDPALKGFHRMAKNGVQAEYVQPIFPANSYPNWYTIVTGLYAENHGMVQNFMYDPKANETFEMTPPVSQHPHWWNQAEPLWVVAEKQGVKTAVYWWDGCQVNISNIVPTFCKPYRSFWSWPDPKEDTIDAIDDIVDKFEDKTWQLAMVYYEAVDSIGHIWGPETKERIDAVKDLDDIILHAQEEVAKRNLQDEVTILVVSDHGMTNVSDGAILVDIDKYVSPEDVSVMLDRGSTTFLIPEEGKKQKVLNDLRKTPIKGINVYERSELPEKYHIKNNDRVSPIVLVADKGYFIRGFQVPGLTKPTWDVIYTGHHGYDPYEVDAMRTIMVGTGPGLRKGFVSQPLIMTDHYNIFCHQLGINARPNNGSWIRVQDMFSESHHIPKYIRVTTCSATSLICSTYLVAIITIVYSLCAFHSF